MPLPPLNDERRDLAAALNTTAEKLNRYETQIRQGERMKTLGRLGAGMAHQLRNAITGARMALDLHAAELPAKMDRESLTMAGRQLALMEAYLKRFLTLGRSETPVRQDVNLSALASEALQLVAPICRHHAISVTWQPPDQDSSLRGDADALRQMLLNVLINAIEAVQPLPVAERKIGIELPSTSDGKIPIRIWDHGPGPATNVAPRLFEPFVTDKPDGTGLGLAVAQDIAQGHGGTIRWHRSGGTTVFEVELVANSQANSGT
jgi:signal transduction histidine kinase